MSTNDYTDEQYLRLVDNTIIKNTQYKTESITGGNVQTTCNGGKDCKYLKHSINLFFGYDTQRNSLKYTQEIEESLLEIWNKAIVVKMKSKKNNGNSTDINELDSLMNNDYSSYDVRTNNDKQLIDIVKKVNVSGSSYVSESHEDSTNIVRNSNETTTTTISNTMKDYFENKNINADINDEFEKFLDYGNNRSDAKNIELNWKRWVELIRTPTKASEKSENKFDFNSSKAVSDKIKDWLDFELKIDWISDFKDKGINPFSVSGKKIGYQNIKHPHIANKFEDLLYIIDEHIEDVQVIENRSESL